MRFCGKQKAQRVSQQPVLMRPISAGDSHFLCFFPVDSWEVVFHFSFDFASAKPKQILGHGAD